MFDLLEKFAGYGFNKSHAAAYAVVAYQTAYLKANYPVEFFCAMMTNDMADTAKLSEVHHRSAPHGHRSAAAGRERKPGAFRSRAHPPPRELNSSVPTTELERGAIRFGLAAIKGVGEVAVEALLKARNEGGPFRSLANMCERVDGRTVNRKGLEGLIKSGACDCLGQNRATLFSLIERTLSRAATIISDRQRGQSSLFGALESQTPEPVQAVKLLDEWPEHDMLAHEKELLGFYVTGHPLTPYAPLLEKFTLTNLRALAELPNRSLTRVGGMVAAVQNGFSKKSGKPYCLATVEDLEGSVQVLCMNENYDKYRELLAPGKALLLIGEVVTGEEKPKLFPQEIMLLEDAPRKFTKQVHLRLQTSHFTPARLDSVLHLVAAHPGRCPLFLCFMRPSGEIIFVEAHERYFVAPSRRLQDAADELFGADTYYPKVDNSLPERQLRRWERKPDGDNGE